MVRCLSLGLLLVGSFLITSDCALAQQRQNQSVGNQFGAQNLGNNSQGLSGLGTQLGAGANPFGNSGSGNSGFGASAFGNSGFGAAGQNTATGRSSSNFGNSSASQSTQGATGMNANSANGMSNANGQFGASNPFNTANPFNTQGTGTQATGAAGNRNARNVGGNRSLFGQQGGLNAFNAINAGQQRAPGTIQPSLQLGFTPPTRAPEQVASVVESRMKAVANRPSRLGPAKPEFTNVEMAMSSEGVLTLTGNVPSESARRLAENMVRLEPGVRKIVNQLKIDDATK